MRKRAFLLRNYRRQHHQFRCGWPSHHLVNNILHRPTRHFRVTNWTMRYTNTCKQQTQIIINLSHRSYSRARVARSGLLVNRNRRRKTRNHIYVWLIHYAQEHSRIGRQGFHITTLPLGINRIEGQGRLTRAGKSCYYD